MKNMSNMYKQRIYLDEIEEAHKMKNSRGVYVDLTLWMNDEPNEYGNIGSLQASKKVGDEWERKYVGNVYPVEPRQE
jgi:hypothetical protein